MQAIAALVARATAVRRDIHQHPELGYEEERTAGVVRRELDRLGIAWRACAGTGTVAVLGAKARGRRLAFRADLDALPIVERSGVAWTSRHDGKMHACGHDGHTASLIGAAEYLKSREADLPGPVTLLFQPAEERGAGARKMIDDGCLAEVDEVYGYHNWPMFPLGKAGCIAGALMAGNAEFDAAITGRGGHGSAPHEAIDPVPVAAAWIQLVQQIVSRRLNPIDPGVISVTAVQAGTTYNIIPETVTMMGTVRAVSTALRDDLGRQAGEMLQTVARAAGCTATWQYRGLYPATINDAGCAAKATAALERVLGPGATQGARLPIMGAEDFAFYLEQRPGCYILMGSAKPGEPRAEPCHSPRFDFNDELIPRAVRLWADLAGVPVRG